MIPRDPAPVDRIGDVHFEDPFRALEDESPAVLEWQAALDRHALDTLRATSGFEATVEAVARSLGACRRVPPRRGGDRWFSLERAVEGDDAVLLVAEAPGAEGARLVRAKDLREGPQATFDWYAPSPDGRRVAAGVSTRGDEQSALHIVDAETGRATGPVLAHVSGGRVAWLPDGGGLYCCAGRSSDQLGMTKDLAFVSPDGRADWIPVPHRARADHRLSVHVSADGRYVGVGGEAIAPRLIAVLDRREDRWIDGVACPYGTTFHGAFVGSRYVAVTTLGAGRGRVVSAELAELGDPDAWSVLVEEGSATLRALTLAGDRLVLFAFEDGYSRIRLLTLDGEPAGDVPIEADGLVTSDPLDAAQYGGDPPAAVDADGIGFSFSKVGVSPALMRFELRSGELRCLARPEIELPGIVDRRCHCVSADGTPVPYHVVGSGAAEAGPTVLVGYGGWNAMTAARGYPALLAPILEAGGTIAFADLRGDAVAGVEQWHAARRAAKQRTFDDFIAVAEALVDTGVADPARLGIYGGSNGGLLVGGAVTQRPELFRAAVALVPLFDMCRLLRERFAEITTVEYGDPRVEEEAAWIAGYSPYHRVSAGTAYPATLIVCGEADMRCHPWHGRKMAAALQAAQSGEDPVLLRVHGDRGHQSTGPFAPPWLIAEWVGFLMHHLGLEPVSEDQQREHAAG